MTRVNTFASRDDLPEDRRHEYDAVFERLGRVRGPYTVALHSPGFAPALLATVVATSDDVLVSAALHELVILAIAHFYDAPYQWSAHVGRAREVGLADAAIEVARARGAAEAQKIVRSTLSGSYLHYLWIKTLNQNPNVIYVATEDNMPIFEEVGR